jgi:hypothetical protein
MYTPWPFDRSTVPHGLGALGLLRVSPALRWCSTLEGLHHGANSFADAPDVRTGREAFVNADISRDTFRSNGVDSG